MSQRITITIPDIHYKWLTKVMKKRGWDSVQGAIRSLIEDSFRLDEKAAGKIDEPVNLKVQEEAAKEGPAIPS